ncbi:Transcriptional activator of proteases prtT [Colletotrichum spinosum]|uniref:Transcriptional activator of proteases prtT n=1 Tax=Colletotrichum spinosum TaxID=1347390 RepID=A0A4V3HRQ2_9PEZI|nr:Transcriptional activator of proteases prtT [Colletotrichum spinosum]
MSSPKKHVVFDIVGTCMSYDVIYEAIDARLGPQLAAHNIKPALLGWAWIEAAEREYTYLSMQGRYRRFYDVAGILFHRMLYMAGVPDPRALATTDDVAYIMARFLELRARPGAKECFALLREAGFTVWAFTAGDAERVGGYFDKAGIELPAENLRSCDADGVGKPDPRAYRSILEGFGGEEAWFAAAHMWDASAARGCGFKGAWCSVYEKEPCVELFGEMDVMADSLPEMARKIIAASASSHAHASPSPPASRTSRQPSPEDNGPTEEATVEPLNHIPIKSLYEIAGLESLRPRQLYSASRSHAKSTTGQPPRDLVSLGKIEAEVANRLVRKFLDQTDHYLYGTNAGYADVDSVRRASPLLFAAICTVSALHEPGGESLFQTCNLELRKLIQKLVFASQISTADFQGLCIASFWLSDVSWSVSGLAIRRAMEFQLGKSFDLVVGNDNVRSVTNRMQLRSRGEALDCLRVWYLFYVCDHHLSILYSRPSSFGKQVSVVKWELYLQALPETRTDTRLSSQLELLSILDQVTGLFGTDVHVGIPASFHLQLTGFNHRLDQWVMTWTDRYKPHDKIGMFPFKSLMLHYHFAKLFVSSHVFRSDDGSKALPSDCTDVAQVAVSSARAIVELTANDPDIKIGLVGMAHYCHTMIAYACSFLLKLATSRQYDLGLDQNDTFRAIRDVAVMCESAQCTRFHLLHWMGAGLRQLVAKCEAAMVGPSGNPRGTSDDHADVSADVQMQEEVQDGQARSETLLSQGNAWNMATDIGALGWPPGDGGSLGYDGLEMGIEGFDLGWESLLPSFDLDQMGFGLL